MRVAKKNTDRVVSSGNSAKISKLADASMKNKAASQGASNGKPNEINDMAGELIFDSDNEVVFFNLSFWISY